MNSTQYIIPKYTTIGNIRLLKDLIIGIYNTYFDRGIAKVNIHGYINPNENFCYKTYTMKGFKYILRDYLIFVQKEMNFTLNNHECYKHLNKNYEVINNE